MVRLTVAGMTCAHCVQAVTKAVHSVAPGVQVEINRENSEVIIGATVDRDRFVAAITDAGFDTE